MAGDPGEGSGRNCNDREGGRPLSPVRLTNRQESGQSCGYGCGYRHCPGQSQVPRNHQDMRPWGVSGGPSTPSEVLASCPLSRDMDGQVSLALRSLHTHRLAWWGSRCWSCSAHMEGTHRFKHEYTPRDGRAMGSPRHCLNPARKAQVTSPNPRWQGVSGPSAPLKPAAGPRSPDPSAGHTAACQGLQVRDLPHTAAPRCLQEALGPYRRVEL